MTLTLHVYHQQRPVFSTYLSGVLEIGRQQPDEPKPYCQVPAPHGSRLIVADQAEASLSRRHVLIEPQSDRVVQLSNLSKAVTIATDRGGIIEPGQHRQLEAPFVLVMGDRSIRVEFEAEVAEQPRMVSLANVTMAPGRQKIPSTRLRMIPEMQGGADGVKIVEWLQDVMSVFQSAASSPDFLERAAQAVVHLVGLDTAAVMIWDGARWKPEAVYNRRGDVASAWRPSSTILEAARREKRTFHHASQQHAASLMGVEALVAAPILDARGDVIGAIYGDRRQPAPDRNEIDITQLEAMLVELLATGVAAGLARLEQERSALAARVRFEQFFTPELAQQLELHPNLLEGKDAEITALFCDVRGFSRISERLGSVRTFAWICDVMEEFSECIQRFGGVLVDYIGDEVIAMWGAPVENAEHALLACRAALAMISKLPALNERWAQELGEPVSIGIGINSGLASVGNTGSTRKFKYGPLGNTVNLASRVQGATKYLKAKVLITGDTTARLGPEIQRRRLSRVRVVNIATPVDLYELVAVADDSWCQLRDRYEAALEALERKEFFIAMKYLGNLVADYPHDGPSQLLLARAVNAMISRDDFDITWELTGK